jgi:hypothetical protein
MSGPVACSDDISDRIMHERAKIDTNHQVIVQ